MYSDKFREPRKSILKVFFYGCLICIPAFFANTILDSFWFYQTKVPEELIGSFLAPAFVEEALKFSVLYYVVYKMKDFKFVDYEIIDCFTPGPRYQTDIENEFKIH